MVILKDSFESGKSRCPKNLVKSNGMCLKILKYILLVEINVLIMFTYTKYLHCERFFFRTVHIILYTTALDVQTVRL